MAFDFPANPTEGQQFTPPVGDMRYIYRDPYWEIFTTASGGLADAPTDGQVYGRRGLDSSWYAITKTLVGLGNVDNTSDANKPISISTQTALDLKENLLPASTSFYVLAGTKTWMATADLPISTATQSALNLKANIASPALTGIPTAPTANPGTNTIQIATTAFVTAAFTANAGNNVPLMNGLAAPGTLFLYARADHVHPSDTSRIAKAGDAMTGPLTLMTGTPANSAYATNKQYVDDVANWAYNRAETKLPLAGGTMTGRLVTSGATGWTGSGSAGLGGLEVTGAGGGNSAMICFHRPGQFAAYFGLDSDNVWRVGGWSYGEGTAYAIWHSGNHNPGAYLPLSGGTISGGLWVTGTVTGASAVHSGQNFQSNGVNAVLAASGGTVYLRPHGAANAAYECTYGPDGVLAAAVGVRTQWMQGNYDLVLGGQGGILYWRPYGVGNGTNQATIHPDGAMVLTGTIFSPVLSPKAWYFGGVRCKNGASGDIGPNVYNLMWAGLMGLWVDDTWLGNIAIQSDYRIKKDVEDLPSMWETTKKYRPIKYTHQEWWPEPVKDGTGKTRKITQPLIPADDIERWGFIAHDLQDATIPDAATGVKDQTNALQQPNPWTMLAALTKTLQEAQARIEALEAT
jgi:Chaperone of endosialidase